MVAVQRYDGAEPATAWADRRYSADYRLLCGSDGDRSALDIAASASSTCLLMRSSLPSIATESCDSSLARLHSRPVTAISANGPFSQWVAVLQLYDGVVEGSAAIKLPQRRSTTKLVLTVAARLRESHLVGGTRHSERLARR